MEFVQNDEKYINVRSLTLLKKLNDAKCMRFLEKVVFSHIEEKPIYMFEINSKVQKIVNDFCVDNRSSDPDLWWKHYKPRIHQLKNLSKLDTVTTRKYHVVSEIFDLGYMCNLIDVFVDYNGKKGFVFLHEDEIADVKIRIDLKDHNDWLEKERILDENESY